MKLSRVIVSMLGAVLVMAAAVIGVGSPAGATEAVSPALASIQDAQSLGCGPLCGYINHHSPDVGYDRAFTIRCDGYTTNHYVAEGTNSKKYCNDTGKIYVHTNEQIICQMDGGWGIKWDSTGWHNVTNFDSVDCMAMTD